MSRLFIFVVCVLVSTSEATSVTDVHAPRIISTSTSDGGFALFHGSIREDETVVQLSEVLHTDDGDEGEAGLICGYVIHHAKEKHIPFAVEVTNSRTGTATIRVRDGGHIDFEHRKSFKFAISAFNCGEKPKVSKRAMVHIAVEDVNEYAPVFEKSTYRLELEEGRLYSNIITLKASDGDRSPQFHLICSYHVDIGNETFDISKDGVLRNTVPLERKVLENHIVTVTAMDCGHLKSKSPAILNIKVIPKCKRGWSGIPERIEYTPGSGYLKFASSAKLNLCDKECNVKRVSADVTLSTKHIGKGCDRDTFTMHAQRQICGASTESTELLPSPSAQNSWTKDLVSDDGHASDLMFSFDGKMDAVEVPRKYFDHKLKSIFTISTWMKHDGRDDDDNGGADDDEDEKDAPHHKGSKEHILCMSDSNKMNRHHYSWYLHGNKMVFLLRQEAEDAKDKQAFRPAEWRWNLRQANDNAWHHYAISFTFPKVELYVDGELTTGDQAELEVVDDWPLHKTHKVKNTKLLIGACWQGGDQKLDMFFHGYLAGLYILNGHVESDQVINCLTHCKEYLDFETLKKQHTGMTVSFTRDQSHVSISGNNVAEVEDVVRELNYRNARGYPTPGRRNLQIDTTVTCAAPKGSNKPLPPPVIPRLLSYILVLQAQTPILSLGGGKNVAYSVDNLANGRKLFKSLTLDVKLSGQDSETVTKGGSSGKFLVDRCRIVAEPNLFLKAERLTFPRQFMKIEGSEQVMDSVETNEEVVITGPTTTAQYEKVLRGMVYYNEQANKLSSRKFIVQCSSQSQRFVSNKILFTVSAIHVEHKPVYHAHAQAHPAHVAVAPSGVHHTVSAAESSTPTGFGMIAIIVVCVGFLMFMIVLGIFRIRAYQRRTTVVHVDEKQEMEWDDSILNITVNPMEQDMAIANEYTSLKPRVESDMEDEDEYEEDENSSSHDDGDSSDDYDNDVKKGERELAWDDSTLSF